MADTSQPKERPEAPAGDAPYEDGEVLYHDPFAGRGICAKARSLAPGIRGPVTQACPRCGVLKDTDIPPDQRTCLLEGIALDVMALEAEDDLHEVRAQLAGPLPY